MSEYLSLYEYLHRAAGEELGEKVNKYAQSKNQPIKTKYIKNPVYEGKVHLYTRGFLDEYFKEHK